MVSRMANAVLLVCVLSGLCLPVQANTTAKAATAVTGPGASAAVHPPQLLAQTDLALPPVPVPLTDQPMVRIALLLPTQSEALRTAAEMVRAGFQAGFERDPHGVDVQLVETGDAPQDVLTGFNAASIEHDIVVGPLSRTGVTAVAQSASLQRPTIALNTPDANASGDVPLALPAQMLPIGLSVEDEARQVAGWAASQHPRARALIVFTGTAWQRRAARAFEQQWQQLGRESEPVELQSSDGFVNARALLQMKPQLEQQPEVPVLIFAALDARQARQVRALMGPELPLYGTSQLNSSPPPQLQAATPGMPDMDGVRLVEIPWLLQPDHPAVMAYPVLPPLPNALRSADLERLYALGIDAYRVAHEIAMQRRSFELDGVTGKLAVSLDAAGARFSRSADRAVYRNGAVVPLPNGR
ncbi:penicillin-binding protein activator [Noviherbaspirillum aridicola]|uniref:LppC family lipoprotein n=1 Tax=Noviherbaspirillum aridicola TaxID=2849687 RepID=A0ABQ4Q1J1_9BURK|nr:penicillin-binding protein activator [Noviherbaspirillum aridicola]GIZ50705.1 hypothetical protein NCCP691_07190 [Noviherbaspirillum aridicola]